MVTQATIPAPLLDRPALAAATTGRLKSVRIGARGIRIPRAELERFSKIDV